MPYTTPARPHKKQWRMLIAMLCLILISPLLALGILFAPGPLGQDKVVVVTKGMSTFSIARTLKQQDAVYNSIIFYLFARFIVKNNIKAGEYAIPAHSDMMDILAMMRDGKAIVRLFTVPEGLTSFQIIELLKKDPSLSGEVTKHFPDGSLLPETYRYVYGDDRTGMLNRMAAAMHNLIDKEWEKRAPSIPVTSQREALTVASIVEKETSLASERKRIAGVFYNRLQSRMRLQSDPTVIYAITKGTGYLGRGLTHADMSYPSTYNTYAMDGLPPKPICNPGRDSIIATLHPENHKYTYFVANGAGGHTFSTDLKQHNKNVSVLRQIRTKEKQDKKKQEQDKKKDTKKENKKDKKKS